MSFLDKLGYGGKAMVIGLLIVFTGLIIIILCLKLMAAIFNGIQKKKAKKAEAERKAAEKAAQKAAQAAPVQEIAEPEPEAPEGDDLELIAVISAAVAAFMGSGAPVKIKSVKRVNGWKNAARTEQIFKF
ncbi:MAG: OadG family protein [Clostridia bacterium]|nr:OadG family protein [Clostridia bacterium]MBR5010692.1 OadG family protein [Clostridia bacterium]